MPQGLINGEEFGNPEEIGTQYFNELICRSFFEHSSVHDKEEGKFVMPKFFHDIVTSISKDAGLICEDLSSSIPEKNTLSVTCSLGASNCSHTASYNQTGWEFGWLYGCEQI
jgi:hypothetical protein